MGEVDAGEEHRPRSYHRAARARIPACVGHRRQRLPLRLHPRAVDAPWHASPVRGRHGACGSARGRGGLESSSGVVTVLRKLPPPDFRYVCLHPEPGSTGALAAGTAGLAGIAAAVWSAGSQTLSLGLMAMGSALGVLALARAEHRLPAQRGAREVTMAVVPWGILVDPDTEPRVLRWPAVKRVRVDVSHTMRGGTPAIVSSLVTVHTARDVLAGRAAGAVDLERLLANLEGYAQEAARPVAGDIEGQTALGDGVTEPIAAALLQAADGVCATSRGAAQLALPGGGYRTAAARAAAPETVAVLRSALSWSHDCPADPRPLAAILAAELGAAELVPELLRLASSPHPVAAAFGKAAALRLGAPPNRAGSLDEVEAFLFEEDVEIGKRWIASAPTLCLRRGAEAC
ncbi:hypothetical protein [Sorangium sp. So ce1335]|uniref:hypothetical protein n=1 Tax=Sorangium sp. So ce1335 TaxID=3133335 RepID=UPI003F5EC8D2